MSLRATIEDEARKLIWSKSVLALTLISDQIKFDISASNFTISVVNQASTNYGEVRFQSTFFQNYEVNFTNAIQEGLDENRQTYAFIISSSHLSAIFRNFDINSLVDIRINFNYQFKLLLEIKRRLILKKYHISYKPVKNEVDQTWRQFSQDATNRNHINYAIIEKTLLKEFMDMLPANVENFKLEVKNGKIFFNGFNKQVAKNRKILKESVSVTISVALEDLYESNLGDLEPEAITFGLKFFKVFIYLVSQSKIISQPEDEYFEMYFRKAGDPVLFKANFNENVYVNFLHLTNNLDSDATSALKSYKIEAVNAAPEASKVTQSSSETATARNPSTGTSHSLIPTRDSPPLEIDQFHFNSDDDSESEFGPTQIDEVKSIFD